jgi:murein DD-endopeptidase MepM/ murein hydrolase activator NlpD
MLPGMPEHDQCHRSPGRIGRALRLCAALLLVGPLLGSAEVTRPAPAAAALAFAPAAPAAPAARFRWPLDGVPHVVRPFVPPPKPWLPGHRGVDLAAPPGATVRAAGAGWVRFGRLVAGHPGCPAVACLHWGLRRGDAYLDPLTLLGLGRVRLLPRYP